MATSYRRCCGIDVHKKSIQVYVLPPQGQTQIKALEREYRTFSRDLRRLRGWLSRQRVSEVVMESTGQYWRAVWNVLEGEIPRLVLVNPQHVKALAGRKTDRIDSQRLARYLENNDLAGSFVPPPDTGAARSDPLAGASAGGSESGEEPNRTNVRSRQYQSVERGDRSVWSVGPAHARGGGRRQT